MTPPPPLRLLAQLSRLLHLGQHYPDLSSAKAALRRGLTGRPSTWTEADAFTAFEVALRRAPTNPSAAHPASDPT